MTRSHMVRYSDLWPYVLIVSLHNIFKDAIAVTTQAAIQVFSHFEYPNNKYKIINYIDTRRGRTEWSLCFSKFILQTID